ncbi:BgTH12-04308 [Blumeria graminis f. sp. triticale]|uniref:BgTH12-04308 n=1 Tax=Blumeria graminis f. sp. triticale TaxID=1689686 RepID=A0A9W4CYI3_BLUGR|nr:BgTH12-04308 [Blumeria graminis f. sp. triticale]
MGNSYEGEDKLCDQLLRACRQSTKLAPAIYKPAGDPEELMANLRSTIINHTLASQFFVERSSAPSSEQYYLVRHYNNSRPRDKNQSYGDT